MSSLPVDVGLTWSCIPISWHTPLCNQSRIRKVQPFWCIESLKIFENPQFVVDGARSSDIEQGRIGIVGSWALWLLCRQCPDWLKGSVWQYVISNVLTITLNHRCVEGRKGQFYLPLPFEFVRCPSCKLISTDSSSVAMGNGQML